jgi:hypothetical protein
MTTTASLVTIPAAVAAASEIAATLASPGTVLPDGYRGDGRRCGVPHRSRTGDPIGLS